MKLGNSEIVHKAYTVDMIKQCRLANIVNMLMERDAAVKTAIEAYESLKIEDAAAFAKGTYILVKAEERIAGDAGTIQALKDTNAGLIEELEEELSGKRAYKDFMQEKCNKSLRENAHLAGWVKELKVAIDKSKDSNDKLLQENIDLNAWVKDLEVKVEKSKDIQSNILRANGKLVDELRSKPEQDLAEQFREQTLQNVRQRNKEAQEENAALKLTIRDLANKLEVEVSNHANTQGHFEDRKRRLQKIYKFITNPDK